MEYMKAYDFDLHYHPGKANMVADASSRKIRDRDSRFTSHLWQCLQKQLGTLLDLSIAYHPQSDGQPERVIQVLENMLRACVLEFGGKWSEYVQLAEFAYNNSNQSSIQMTSYEALCGRPCRSPICWVDKEDRMTHFPEIIKDTTEKIQIIVDRLKTTQSRQKSYADKRGKPLEFQPDDLVFLKLAPRYIGPFAVLKKVGTVSYKVKLPAELSHIHDVFHVSQLKKSAPDAPQVMSWSNVPLDQNVSFEEGPLCILEREEKKLRNRQVSLVKVKWQHHGVEEATWELESNMRKKALEGRPGVPAFDPPMLKSAICE
ncbi:hypothetical protein ACLB2K_007098 [Fragaria x ananassa]